MTKNILQSNFEKPVTKAREYICFNNLAVPVLVENIKLYKNGFCFSLNKADVHTNLLFDSMIGHCFNFLHEKSVDSSKTYILKDIHCMTIYEGDDVVICDALECHSEFEASSSVTTIRHLFLKKVCVPIRDTLFYQLYQKITDSA